MPTLRVLILVNKGVRAQIGDDIDNWQDYEEERLGVRLDVTVKDCDIAPLVHKSFGIVATAKDAETGLETQRELYGLDNIKSLIRAAGVTRQGEYHAVIFLYDFEGTELYRTKPDQLGHWTYWEPLYPGTEFIEVATTLIWDKVGDIFRVLTHEIRHAYVSRIRRRGIAVSDVMDSMAISVECGTKVPNPTGKCVERFPYYKEFEPWASDGNRATQDVLVRKYVWRIVEAPELVGYIASLQALLISLQKQIADILKSKDSALLIRWAEAIRQHEGWYVGSRSYRNNNPGNFRFAPFIKELGAIGKDDGNYAIFPTYAAGWEALLEFLRTAKKNQLIAYRAEAIRMKRPGNIPLLKDFFAVYAPSEDDNNPLQYAEAVAKYIGNSVTVDAPITQI